MNLYEIIGVPKDSTQDQIKKQYLKKAKFVHSGKMIKRRILTASSFGTAITITFKAKWYDSCDFYYVDWTNVYFI